MNKLLNKNTTPAKAGGGSRNTLGSVSNSNQSSIKSVISQIRQKVPSRHHDYIFNPPKSGDGFHRYLYHAGLRMGRYVDGKIIAIFLSYQASFCGRYVPETEIQNAIDDSYAYIQASKTGDLKKVTRSSWPSYSPSRVAKVLANQKFDELGLLENDFSQLSTEEILVRLFKTDELVCLGTKINRATTRKLSRFL